MDDIVVPHREARDDRGRQQAGRLHPEAVPRRPHHAGRALQPRRRGMVQDERGADRGDDEDPRARSSGLQQHLHDGQFGRARKPQPDTSARRHARPHGQALGRHHRTAHPLEFPRGAVGHRVLHLDERRAKGPRRYGPQDRRRRLPHAAPRRHLAGRRHQRGRLRHDQRRPPYAHQGRRGGHRGLCASASSGRYALDPIRHPITGDLIVAANEEITEDIADRIDEAGIEEVTLRTVLTCEAKHGVCRKCYGRNLATGRTVEIGEAVGIIAAQSIGQPGTQLTMRTFHIGGAATKVSEENRIYLKYAVLVTDVAGTYRQDAGRTLPVHPQGRPPCLQDLHEHRDRQGRQDPRAGRPAHPQGRLDRPEERTRASPRRRTSPTPR